MRFSTTHLIRTVLVTLILTSGCREVHLDDPTPARSKGIDVSHFQGTVNWKRVAEGGVSFAFAKATEGATYTDPKFTKNWSAMKKAGLIRGAYHFLDPATDGAKQARHFLSVVSLEKGDLPPVVDVERMKRTTNKHLFKTLTAYLGEINARSGHTAIIYVSPAFWKEHIAANLKAPLSNPLWVAEYGVSSPREVTKLPPWTFWQHSQKGKIPGINGDVDLDWGRNVEALRIRR